MAFTPTKYFNFLPPKDQWPGNQNQNPGDNIPQNIGNINFLDDYIPPYQITKGDIYPLNIDTNTGLATNLIGTTGPTGCTGGSSGNPAATPFIMSVYSQVLNGGSSSNTGGIIQMVLLNGNQSSSVQGNNNVYYFASARDLTNYNNVALVYYSLHPETNGRVSVKFYDYKSIQKNPTSQVKNYELQSLVYGDYSGNANTFAAWPYKSGAKSLYPSGFGYSHDPDITRPNFQFNELIDTINVNLKSGKLYHPYNIYMTYDDGTNNQYSNYNEASGYVPGYPLNINYIYSPINSNSEIINSGFDTSINQFNLVWPGNFSLNLYNYEYKDLYKENYIDYNAMVGLIDNFQSDTGALGCGCSDNNECSDSSDNYFDNNCNTIQAGIAQYLIYQFIPITQIIPPSTNIITDYTKTYLKDNVTLPPNIPFTPSSYENINGTTGTFPVQIQSIYDGNTGNTGLSDPSILSSCMASPLNGQYVCSGINQSNSYCGFTDYYDSLFAISYDYGTCGATGINTNPFQKGQCSIDNSQICVPNFTYLENLNSYTNPPYICVPSTTGITTTNLEAYISNVPIGSFSKNNGATLSYPPYEPTPILNQNPNYGGSDTGTNRIFLIIAGVLGIILIALIIYAFFRMGKSTNSQSYNSNKYNINKPLKDFRIY